MLNNNQYDNKSINSPFRWAGGKFYARKQIERYIPKHEFYVELLAGGGSIFFHKNKTISVLNDLDKELINCYKIIQNNVEELIKFLKNETASKERHNYYKNIFKPKNDLEKAARYYYLNRTSYSGIMKKVNCYFGYGDKYSMRPENWGRQLIKNHKKLKGVKLTCNHFEKVIDKVPLNKKTFIFIDPPYFNADQDKFYTKSFKKNDHYKMADLIKKINKKVNFLITYDNSYEIKKLYKWARHIEPKEWNYTISRTDDQKNKKKLKDGYSRKRKKGKEIFIFNYKVNKETKQLSFLK